VIPHVQPSEWNRSVGPRLKRAEIRAAQRAKVNKTPGGQTIELGDRSKWRHPWFTQPVYIAAERRWIATVLPGFVNGRAPVYRTTVREMEELPDYGINPLNGERHFSRWVFRQPGSRATTTRIDIPLYHRPAIALNFRKLGFDGDGDVPQFFLERGVQAKPKDLGQQLLGGGVNVQSLQRKPGSRLLRASDIVLHQPRTAITSDISIEPGIVTGISNVTQTLGLRSAAADDVLKIMSTARFAPTAPLAAGIDPLAGNYEEATWDEILVSTVYLLSPPGVPLESEPDSRWTSFVRHGLFWNLSYAQPKFGAKPTDPGVPYIPPLAGGAAQLVINFVTAAINDATQQALNILQAHSMAGHFWTATGGGSDSVIPEVTTPARGKTGLDKAGRLAAGRASVISAMRKTKLDPDFPFRAEPFPMDLLS
jgi:hypothetical protein